MDKKVLIVEDDGSFQKEYARDLEGKAEIFAAYTIRDAERMFAGQKGEFFAIVMDGCMNSSRLNTVPLIRKFRETFSGLMVAAARLREDREILLEAGCDVEFDKSNWRNLISEALGL